MRKVNFEFINDKSVYTDDTVMTVANMLWLIDIKNRNLTKEEEKAHKKVKLIVKQIETQEKASSDLEKIRKDLNDLSK